eukprot:CAMPEP_0182895396 /NCGR_PEP_ID=MMETSP0034_2-20130328/25653_1 /TAXON_ID=156128 /ORGANISM="Nephroselmis pyriformis, Strain CCMP717" /LENGTH=136 /DNA_ID=CAMNT_0025029223 /DNA_START=58 /DNA_END=464 /DNA_ORIENTATION=+
MAGRGLFPSGYGMFGDRPPAMLGGMPWAAVPVGGWPQQGAHGYDYDGGEQYFYRIRGSEEHFGPCALESIKGWVQQDHIKGHDDICRALKVWKSEGGAEGYQQEFRPDQAWVKISTVIIAPPSVPPPPLPAGNSPG